MKQDMLLKAVDETLELLLNAADEYLDEITVQFTDVGSPEKLIGKPYEQWGARDFQVLSAIYGNEEPNPLSKLIFNKSYEKVKDMEARET